MSLTVYPDSYNSDKSTKYLNDNLSKVIYYMEYLIILFPYISTRFDEKIKSALKTAIKLLLCSMLIGTIFIIAETIQDFNTIALYVGGLVLFLDLAILIVNKINLKREEKKMLYLYIFLISIYQYIESNYYFLGDDGVIIALSIKLLSYYVMFLAISKCNFAFSKSLIFK